MYPCHCDLKLLETPETDACEQDLGSIGIAYDLENWYITEERAARFRHHLQQLLPLAERGNALAQIRVADIRYSGLCYSSREAREANYHSDIVEMTKWLEKAARQGIVAAIDLLVTAGVGPEADRVRSICREVQEERSGGQNLPIGETWNRAYGNT